MITKKLNPMFAWMVEGNEPVNVIKADPVDNKYLASAIEGEADFTTSGDWHLLDLGNYQEIAVVDATEFISIWRKTEKANDYEFRLTTHRNAACRNIASATVGVMCER